MIELSARKLPIGIQDFEDLRRKGFVYVDKTEYVWKLATEGKPYFLSRPRRFGKSLLLTTLKAYFQGKKELFDGLAIANRETEWREYPVIHLDFNPSGYGSAATLNNFVADCLCEIEKKYGLPPEGDSIAVRFNRLITRIFAQTGKQAVVLVDEYDKPLLESMDNAELNAELRAVLKPFYGVLKSADAALRFVMLTGVTRFSKVSIFSDLNQLNEIGMNENYAGICGITERELLENFGPEMDALAEKMEMSFEKTLETVRKNFNGYHFCEDSEGVFNPFSLLNTFNEKKIKFYWFATGTPTFLFGELKRTGFDVRQFESGIEIPEMAINDYQPEDLSPVPLLYQSGYLTITGYDRETCSYTLGFPNGEVKYGFLNGLYSYLFPASRSVNGLSVLSFIKAVRAGEIERFLTQLRAFFAAIPYDLYFAKDEAYYRTIFYIVFTLLGQFTEAEVRSAAGRADAVVKTKDAVYVFEFKVNTAGTAEDALKQIDDKGYLVPYTADKRKLVKIGVVFDTEKRTLGEWRICESGAD
ncbi:MAG: ATP-binding protein [Spirochaetaceae bacterium]|jgi:hypothetical protein|nr:ATP-binding protein [Spirochaetaceae bacterium]